MYFWAFLIKISHEGGSICIETKVWYCRAGEIYYDRLIPKKHYKVYKNIEPERHFGNPECMKSILSTENPKKGFSRNYSIFTITIADSIKDYFTLVP